MYLTYYYCGNIYTGPLNYSVIVTCASMRGVMRNLQCIPVTCLHGPCFLIVCNIHVSCNLLCATCRIRSKALVYYNQTAITTFSFILSLEKIGSSTSPIQLAPTEIFSYKYPPLLSIKILGYLLAFIKANLLND